MAAELESPFYAKPVTAEESRCGSCHACEKICPSHAIDDDVYDYRRCTRAYMCGEPMEDWVMDAMTSMLGCELCQSVCPYNNDIKPIDALPDALHLEQLLADNIKPALEIVGKNLNKQGRIIQHACVIAAHQGRSDLVPLIEPWLEDQREAVCTAADYALRILRG